MPAGEDAAGRLEKALSRKSSMHVEGESDGRILPAKCPNNGEQAPAEGMEERRPTKENIGQATPPRTQSRTSELNDLRGVREVARRVNLIPTCVSTPGIRGRSRMQQFCTYGSVRGAPGNRRPYRDKSLRSLHPLSYLPPVRGRRLRKEAVFHAGCYFHRITAPVSEAVFPHPARADVCLKSIIGINVGH